MTAQVEVSAQANSVGQPSETTRSEKPVNAAAVKKAVATGKEMSKQADVTKAEVARKMFETISGEPREVIIQAFVDGAGLTPKGAQTYFYNCKRKAKKTS